MLIVKMEGGLGNQLLQYLFGLSLSHLKDSPVFFDISEYIAGRGIRKFGLSELQLPGNFFSCHKTGKLQAGSTIELSEFVAHLGGATPSATNKIKLEVVEEPGTNFMPNFQPGDSGYFAGYWGSYHYWQPQQKLLAWLNQHLDTQSELRSIGQRLPFNVKPDDCALHVRRGDYLSVTNTKWHGICSPVYFQAALNEQHAHRNFFFSDDIDYLNQQFSKLPNFINASALLQNEIDEFLVLRQFSKLIISNSSYSYLAGLLGTLHKEKSQVITPRPWFKFNLEHPDFPPDWIPRNNVTGRSAQDEVYLAKCSRAGVLIDSFEHNSIDELKAAIETIQCQSHQPSKILLRTKLAREQTMSLLAQFSNLEILHTPSEINIEYDVVNRFRNSCDYIFFMSSTERWGAERILSCITTSIQTNADVVVSDLINPKSLSPESTLHHPLRPKICDAKTLFQRSRLNVLFGMATIQIKSCAVATDQLISPSVLFWIVFSKNQVVFDARTVITLKPNSLRYEPTTVQHAHSWLTESKVHDPSAELAFYNFFSQYPQLDQRLRGLMKIDERSGDSLLPKPTKKFHVLVSRLLRMHKKILRLLKP
jgi:hypothetical protein